jgi:hypothetical protein
MKEMVKLSGKDLKSHYNSDSKSNGTSALAINETV